MNVTLAALVALMTAILTHVLEGLYRHREHLRLKRAEKLEPIHGAFVDAELAIDQMSPGVHPEQYETIQADIASKVNILRTTMMKSRIWLDEPTCQVMEQAWDALKAAGYTACDYADETTTKPRTNEDLNRAKEACKRARLDIEAASRRILQNLTWRL